MRAALVIILFVVVGFYGSRIADNPLGGVAATTVLGAIVLLAWRIRSGRQRKQRQDSPPKRV